MHRALILPLLLVSAPSLGGCVAGIAVNAVDLAVRGAQGTPESNEQLQPTAGEACRARAATYGAVHIIDIEQNTASRIIVWGIADDGKQRRSFRCTFGTKISGFKLRNLPPAQRPR